MAWHKRNSSSKVGKSHSIPTLARIGLSKEECLAPQSACPPPSTAMSAKEWSATGMKVEKSDHIPPVIYEASSLIRKAIIFATSSGVPILFIMVPELNTLGSTRPDSTALWKLSPLAIGPLKLGISHWDIFIWWKHSRHQSINTDPHGSKLGSSSLAKTTHSPFGSWVRRHTSNSLQSSSTGDINNWPAWTGQHTKLSPLTVHRSCQVYSNGSVPIFLDLSLLMSTKPRIIMRRNPQCLQKSYLDVSLTIQPRSLRRLAFRTLSRHHQSTYQPDPLSLCQLCVSGLSFCSSLHCLAVSTSLYVLTGTPTSFSYSLPDLLCWGHKESLPRHQARHIVLLLLFQLQEY